MCAIQRLDRFTEEINLCSNYFLPIAQAACHTGQPKNAEMSGRKWYLSMRLPYLNYRKDCKTIFRTRMLRPRDANASSSIERAHTAAAGWPERWLSHRKNCAMRRLVLQTNVRNNDGSSGTTKQVLKMTTGALVLYWLVFRENWRCGNGNSIFFN